MLDTYRFQIFNYQFFFTGNDNKTTPLIRLKYKQFTFQSIQKKYSIYPKNLRKGKGRSKYKNSNTMEITLYI